MTRENLAKWKEFIQRNIKAVWYAGVILAAFIILILVFTVDWKTLFGLRAADSCPAELSGTILDNQTIVAGDYPNGVIDCSMTDIVIATGVTITVQGYDNEDDNWENDYGVTWLVGSLNLNVGAVINANGKGYVVSRGMGAGGDGTGGSGGGGGGYGGAGGEGAPAEGEVGGTGGDAYGDDLLPSYLGSGGGNSGTGAVGGAGGGFLKIDSTCKTFEGLGVIYDDCLSKTGVVTINGSIQADGLPSGDVLFGASGGGGSGGTVWVDARVLSGAGGVVSAVGGDAADAGLRGGGGGGGRVVLLCTQSNDIVGGTLSTMVSGGVGGLQNGQEGTLIGPTCYPNAPTELEQYAYREYVDGAYSTNKLNVNEPTRSDDIQFRMKITDVDPSDTLYPQIEIQDINTAFINAPTHTGEAFAFSGTEIPVDWLIESFPVSTRYHWQVRVRDEAGAVSDWVQFGDNAETETDFMISGAPTTLSKISGDNQTGTVLYPLAEPLVARILDASGIPVPFYDVTWAVVLGGGSTSDGRVYSNRQGFVSTVFTLGSESGTNNNTATATKSGLSGSPMTFTASAGSDVTSYYEVIVPLAAVYNESFSVTINARDSYDNLVLSNNETLSLSAVLAESPELPGNGTLCVELNCSNISVSLINGTLTIDGVKYDTVESIKLKVTDNLSIMGLSNTISIVESYGSCPDLDGIIDHDVTWSATLANGGIIDCSGRSIVVKSGYKLTLASYDNEDGLYDNDFGLTLLADNITVEANAHLSANGQGYPATSGPGYKTKYGSSHGGYGYGATVGDGSTYGGVITPLSLGSGGGLPGVNGGGAIKLIVNDTILVNGRISADGLDELATSNNGGASGGSIILDTSVLSGSGIISTNGGNAFSGGGGGGGGGRVSVKYASFAGGFSSSNIQSYGGGQTYYSQYGSAGTIYLEQTGVDISDSGALIVDGGSRICSSSSGVDCRKVASVLSGNYSFRTIQLSNGGNVEFLGSSSVLNISDGTTIVGDGTSKMVVYGAFNYGGADTFNVSNYELQWLGSISGISSVDVGTPYLGGLGLHGNNWSNGGHYIFDTFRVRSGSYVDAYGYDNGNDIWTDDYGVVLQAETITIDAGGVINADGLGYQSNRGPGYGYNGSSHGGYGINCGGPVYGDLHYPLDLGSAVGGGAIKLIAHNSLGTGALDVSGIIRANALSTGKGSGGSILIDSDNLNLGTSFVIQANGGNTHGNEGGGGRVAVYYNNLSGVLLTDTNVQNHISAYGGDYLDGKTSSAGPGTIYIENRSLVSPGQGYLYVDNNDINYNRMHDKCPDAKRMIHSAYAGILEGNYNFSKIRLTRNGHLRVIGSTGSLTINSSNVITGDSSSPTLLVDGSFIHVDNLNPLDVNGVNLTLGGNIQGVSDIQVGSAMNGALTLLSDNWAYSLADPYVFDDIEVFGNGALYIRGFETGDPLDALDPTNDYSIPLITNNITVLAGGKVSGDGLGYGMIRYSEKGPGYTFETGGTYGGYGERSSIDPMGDVYEPILLGSAGGNCSGLSLGSMVGGAGGGALTITVNGTLAIYGEVTSNGSNPYRVGITSCENCGGAGGSILIRTNNLAGSGEIKANGYNPGVSKDYDGAGGRIAIYYVNNIDFTLGSSNVYARGSDESGPGTVYVEQLPSLSATPSYNQYLLVDNADLQGLSSGVPEGNYNFSSVNLTGHGDTIFLGETSSITINSGAGFQGDSSIPKIRVDGTLSYTGTGVLSIESVDVGINGDITGVASVDVGLSSPSGMTLYANTWARNRDNPYDFTSLHIGQQGSLRCVGHNSMDIDWENDYGVNLNVGDLTIDSGGILHADATGYGFMSDLSYCGPGYTTSGAGGSHGGYGQGTSSAGIYGSVFTPIHLGSCGTGASGGSGGGAVNLKVSNNLVVNGIISANGMDAISGGSGSGGSILIKAKNLLSSLGNGLIQASGGTTGYVGGGGRIALYYENVDGFLLDVDHLVSRGNLAGPGTVYVEQLNYLDSPTFQGDVFVDNGGVDGGVAGFVEDVYDLNTLQLSRHGDVSILGNNSVLSVNSGDSIIGDGTVPSLRVDGTLNVINTAFTIDGFHLIINGAFSGIQDITLGSINLGALTLVPNTWARGIDDTFSFGNLSLNSNSTLILESHISDDDVWDNDYGVDLEVDYLTVAENAVITASGKGYGQTKDSPNGPGWPSVLNDYGGGTYGGHGQGKPDVPTYGDIYNPVSLGSAGNNCGNLTHGGPGGGVVNINVNNALYLNGLIEADGAEGYKVKYSCSTWGGGSGGSVNIRTNLIGGSGLIRANGYVGESAQYDGGGGRISIYYSENESFDFANNRVQAYGNLGGPGTILIKQSEQQYGDLYLNNGDVIGAEGTDFFAGTYNFDNVFIAQNVRARMFGDILKLPSGLVYPTFPEVGNEVMADADTLLLLHLNESEDDACILLDWMDPFDSCDSSVNENHANSIETTIVDGKYGMARNTNLLQKLEVTPIDPGTTYSISAWAKFPLNTGTYSGYKILIGSNTDLTTHHVIVDGNGKLGLLNSGFYSSGYDVDVLSGWNHIGVVSNGGQTNFYINGESVGTSLSQVTVPIQFLGNGGRVDRNYSWGTFDEVAIYNRALTQTEIRALHYGIPFSVYQQYLNDYDDAYNERTGGGVSFNVLGDFNIGTGSVIDGKGLGFPSGDGPGVGATGLIAGGGEGSGGGGGAYGGNGGLGASDGINGTTTGGLSYGDALRPLYLGSGGGASGAGASGGAGGSAFSIFALGGTVNILGAIDMSGDNGLISSPGGGGGAGGSVLIKAQTVNLSPAGSITVAGGNGGDEVVDGGGGGGGRISILYGSDYVNLGTIIDSGGAGYQVGQVGTILGPFGYPNNPEFLKQLLPESFEVIPIGGTSQSSVILELTATDPNNPDILTPQFEVRPVGVDFTGTPTHTGTATNFTGTPVVIRTTVTDLANNTQYHWRARVRDDAGVYSEWVSFGGNLETSPDFIVTQATRLVLTPSVNNVTAGGFISVDVRAEDDSGIVDTAYRGEVTFSSSDVAAELPNDYSFVADDAGTHSFVNGVRMNTVGTKTITVTDTAENTLTDTAEIEVQPITGGMNATISLSPTLINNDGEAHSTIIVLLLDDGGSPIIGKIVTINSTGTGNNLVQPVGATNEEGKAYGSISSTVAEDKIITAIVDGNVQDASAVLQVRDLVLPEITNVQVTKITQNSAVISWETNEPTTGQVSYGVTSAYGNATDYLDDLSTTHSVTLTELTPETLYHFQILARDSSLNEVSSSDRSFTTLGYSLVITSLNIANVSTSSAVISWTTNMSASALLEYGTTTAYGESVMISSVASSHTQALSNLDINTQYYIRVTAISGNLQDVETSRFTTLSDANAVQIINIKVSNITQASAIVTFGTTKPASITFNYGETVAYGFELTSDDYKETHSYLLENLISDTAYHFQIIASDQDGYRTRSADQMFRTLAEIPTVCAISDVLHERSSEKYLDVSWKTSCTDMICQVDYGETVTYEKSVENIKPKTKAEYLQPLDISKLDDSEIHYRIICRKDDVQAKTRDYLYTNLVELPETGDDSGDLLEDIARFGLPALTGLGLLLQLLNLLAKLGNIPKLAELWGAIFDKDKKKQGWGIVFDIDKKAPIPFAIVRLYKAETSEMVESTVTDLEGRYRFLVADGKYTLGVEHADFVLPQASSDVMKGYDLTGKYLGGEIEVRNDFAVAYDIPLLPKAIADKDDKYHNFKDKFKVFMDKLGFWLNIVGGILMILAIIFAPTILNFALLGLNILILLIIAYITNVLSKNWGYVFELPGGDKVEGVFVRLFDLSDNKLINSQITDDKGRYGFLAEEGEYAVFVESPIYKQDEEYKFKVEKKEKLLKKNIGVRKVEGFPEELENTDTPFGVG